MSREDQESFLMRAFQVHDVDRDDRETTRHGCLPHPAFAEAVRQLVDRLDLSEAVMHRLFQLADVDDQGSVVYADFVPLAAKIIEVNSLRNESDIHKMISKAGATLLACVNQGRFDYDVADIESLMRRLFEMADDDYTGRLDRRQFRRLLFNSGMGLDDRELNSVMASLPKDTGGQVEYAQFVPVAWELITRAVARIRYGDLTDEQRRKVSDLVRKRRRYGNYYDYARELDELFHALEEPIEEDDEMPSILDIDEEDLEEYLEGLFKIADENDDGVLEAEEFRKLMKMSGFDFSHQTVEELLVEADADGNGVIDTTELRTMVDSLREKAIAEDMPCITEVDDDDLEEYLQGLFKIADENDDGTLQPDEFRKLMAISGFGFSEETVERLLKESDTDGDGFVDITELRAMVAKIKAEDEESGAKMYQEYSKDANTHGRAAAVSHGKDDDSSSEEALQDAPQEREYKGKYITLLADFKHLQKEFAAEKRTTADKDQRIAELEAAVLKEGRRGR